MTATALTYYNIDVGDVLAVRTGNNWAARLIRLGAKLAGKPDLDNHVVVAHHVDANGVPWGLEGRPGGVGWADLRNYLADPHTRTNAAQPKTADQRLRLQVSMPAMLGTAYDWHAIAVDAASTFMPDLAELFGKTWGSTGTPGHVVCSSYAAYLYETVGLAHPDLGTERFCEPADWTAFDEQKAWTK